MVRRERRRRAKAQAARKLKQRAGARHQVDLAVTLQSPSEKAASTASGGGGAGNPPGLAQAKEFAGTFSAAVGVRELPMAKGQKRSAKEAKKPKANKTKTSVSDYKKSVIASGHK